MGHFYPCIEPSHGYKITASGDSNICDNK
jgi:hypothetical protein